MASPTVLYRYFIGLQIGGACGMSLILLTAVFSCAVKRCATWYTFCASWIISCLSYSLLFFAGGRDAGSGSAPHPRLCATQAAFVYSVPTLTALTTLALLVHSWYNVHFAQAYPPLEAHPRAMRIILITPFVIWLCIFLSFLAYGLSHTSVVYRLETVPYCVINSVFPAKISSLLVIVIAISMLPVQASLGLSLCRTLYHHDSKRKLSIPTLKVVIRVMIFSLLTLVAFGDGVIHVFNKNPGEYVDIIMAWLPVSGVLIFGIQQDIFKTWAVWMRVPVARLRSHQKPPAAAETSPTMPALTPDNSP